MALFYHVIEHHCDLRDRPADVNETEKEKIEKYLAPRRHLIVCRGIVSLLISCHRHPCYRRCKNA